MRRRALEILGYGKRFGEQNQGSHSRVWPGHFFAFKMNFRYNWRRMSRRRGEGVEESQ